MADSLSRLSQQEIDAGHAYWTASWPSSETLEAWQTLISNRSAQRAAWVLSRPSRQIGQPDQPASQASRIRRCVLKCGRVRGGSSRSARPVDCPGVSRRQTHPPGNRPCHRRAAGIDAEPERQSRRQSRSLRDGFTIAKELQWTIDFDAAHAVGMAFEMPIESSEIALGFDRLLVFGVKPSAAPDANATSLGALLDNHHYTRGLAFVKQGTPTNNTWAAIGIPAARSEWRHKFCSGAQQPEADSGLRWRTFHARSWPGSGCSSAPRECRNYRAGSRAGHESGALPGDDGLLS